MPFLWVILGFFVLLLVQRWIHTHLHGLALLLTGRPERAYIIYAIVLFPGVVLHELSHWLSASLLGVRTGKLSLIPRRQPDGAIQLGYVEYYKDRGLGPIRESLIGGAPLMAGTAVIWLIGWHIFDIQTVTAAVQSGNVDQLALALTAFLQTADLFVWLYLLFAISNAMMPSASDRRAWPAFLLVMGGVVIAIYLLGLADVLVQNLAGPVGTIFSYLGLALWLAVAVDLLFIAFIALLEAGLSRLRGVRVNYHAGQ
jgi:hypothetical protein